VLPQGNQLLGCLSRDVTALILILILSLRFNQAQSAAYAAEAPGFAGAPGGPGLANGCSVLC